MEHPHQTIKHMVRIQLLFCRHNDDLWCFCYQYIVWITYCLINRRLGISTIVAWYKYNNIFYTSPFAELVIWRCKIYIIKSKQGKKVFDPITNKDPGY